MYAVRRIAYHIAAWECARCGRLTWTECACGEWICTDCAANHICEGVTR